MLIMMILMSITSGVTTPQLPISEPMDTEGRQGVAVCQMLIALDIRLRIYSTTTLRYLTSILEPTGPQLRWKPQHMLTVAIPQLLERILTVCLKRLWRNNDWISTGEREAVREIGPMCIEDMDARLGIREGFHTEQTAE